MLATMDRLPTDELRLKLVEQQKLVAFYEAEIAARKRSRSEFEENNDDAAEEPAAKRHMNAEREVTKQKTVVLSRASTAVDEDLSDFSDNEVPAEEGEDAEMEETFAEGSHVAVAYGNLDGKSKRRWYAAVVKFHDPKTNQYTVAWKFAPRLNAKTTLFTCGGDRMKEITADDFKNAPVKGSGYVGFHRQSTFAVVEQPEPEKRAKKALAQVNPDALQQLVAMGFKNYAASAKKAEPSELAPATDDTEEKSAEPKSAAEEASDADEVVSEDESDDEGLQVGDAVAVAYGPSRANKRGNKAKDLKARNTKLYHKRFVWYAATVVHVGGEKSTDVTVEWKHPVSKKNKLFTTSLDKVQPITDKEFKRSRKIAGRKKVYGFMGIHRLETKAGLTAAGK